MVPADGTGPEADALVDALVGEAGEHAERVAMEKRLRAGITALERHDVRVARLGRGVDLDGLGELAERLRQQGAA